MEKDLLFLKEERENALAKLKANETETVNAIRDFFNMHCCPEGAELVVNFTASNTWISHKEDGRYFFDGKIGFKTDDEKRLAKGWITDFGSDFNINIFENNIIEINKGTCGAYRRTDKYQIFRDKMLAMIWDNEEIICGIMKTHFDYSLLQAVDNLTIEIDRIQTEIRHEEERKEKEELMNKLLNAKYFFTEYVHDVYKDNDYWKDEVIGKKHHFSDVFKIEKITNKNVIGYYIPRSWENKRLKIEKVLYDIKKSNITLSEQVPEDYIEEIPPQEGAGA